MTCEELRDDYELYAMGLLDEPSRTEIRAHLESGCATCTAGMKVAREILSGLAAAVPLVDPPRRLRARVLASVGTVQRNWAPVWLALAAGLVIGAFLFGYRTQQMDREMAVLHEMLGILNEPEARQVTFGEGVPKPPRGRVFVHPNRGVLLLASNLPRAPEGKIYEMWVIPKAGNPVPAGLFQSSTEGTAIHLHRGGVDLGATGAVAVTLEPAGGVPAPTTQPLIVAKL